MITVPLINWQPMSMMPEDRKDGRVLLLWDAQGAVVASWWQDEEVWYMQDRRRRYAKEGEITEPNYWADINPPEAEAPVTLPSAAAPSR